MPRVANFIDGAYLQYLLKYEFDAPKIDFGLLARMLGVDLALLAAKHQITDAVLLAGDSDFLPAVQAAKTEGVVVHLFHGKSPHRDLVEMCDERTRFTREMIDSLLLVPPARP